ncbi:hypothetical protein COL516b_004408 [Colletotrichum fioriniae]|nr:uncharacterized protein COL516b_004408 [Colletotrichum fioriniae]KAJ0306615.1 hypothetical protein COL516b_004408 [Colletotrichum fioriniae]
MFKNTKSADRSAREAVDINVSNPESSNTPETVPESPTPTDKKAETHMFNEQTNYVSKVKVITHAPAWIS